MSASFAYASCILPEVRSRWWPRRRAHRNHRSSTPPLPSARRSPAPVGSVLPASSWRSSSSTRVPGCSQPRSIGLVEEDAGDGKAQQSAEPGRFPTHAGARGVRGAERRERSCALSRSRVWHMGTVIRHLPCGKAATQPAQSNGWRHCTRVKGARSKGMWQGVRCRCHSLAQGGFGGLTMGQREDTLFVRQTNSSCLRPSWQSWQTRLMTVRSAGGEG